MGRRIQHWIGGIAKEASPPNTQLNQKGLVVSKDKVQEYVFAQVAWSIFFAILCGENEKRKVFLAYLLVRYFHYPHFKEFYKFRQMIGESGEEIV